MDLGNSVMTGTLENQNSCYFASKTLWLQYFLPIRVATLCSTSDHTQTVLMWGSKVFDVVCVTTPNGDVRVQTFYSYSTVLQGDEKITN